MKHIIPFLLLLCLMPSCSKQLTPTAETTYLTTKDGVLNVRSIGYCLLKNCKDVCVDSAQINAFRTLFYRGIPGSQQNTPLIGIDEKDNTANHKFLKEFFSTGRYKTFIVSTSYVSDVTVQRKQKKVTVDIGINLPSLRKELEHNSVIRKFGY
jgi:hypothetical protein